MRTKKRFGQHFLHNPAIAQRIADALPESSETPILEVGPGRGILTQFLERRSSAFKAVEIDFELSDYLYQHFPNIDLILQDFLKLPLEEVFDGKPFFLIGNFPYNISSQIVFKAISHRDQVPILVGMFQKEMAERIVSPPGSKNYGVISVLTQAFYNCEMLFSVHRRNFVPPPKVTSAVIRLSRDERVFPENLEYRLFRSVVKLAFGQRRKMLKNSLKSFEAYFDGLESFLELRPEHISLEDFIEISLTIQNHKNAE